ncbi:zinc/iron-chelating domain-containing protein [Deinococcus arenae]|uniref:Zinc/iron-chelating domain-containing protein n=1 Tax=Deinococcus arenae TaxID=1452751 RepID=A0A8H9GRR6_9DEIO|nr:YkgJ family cysteine cluster protein [Deinococcus arenae]AWT34818.1 YkgJ family cysteine cluster protein [Deinococcus actinosclerus]GGM51662.1 zinc/iron-chelating domain-containing protein [Deinococcus arenae]
MTARGPLRLTPEAQARFTHPTEYAPRSPVTTDCTACGACCAAPDIHALHKPLGVPCTHLGPDQGCGHLCAIYAARPGVCRSYQPDWVCGEVAPLPTLDARTRRFLEIYGLQHLP